MSDTAGTFWGRRSAFIGTLLLVACGSSGTPSESSVGGTTSAGGESGASTGGRMGTAGNAATGGAFNIGGAGAGGFNIGGAGAGAGAFNAGGAGASEQGGGGAGGIGQGTGGAGVAGSMAGPAPFVDPYSGASGCPTGGSMIGRGSCQLIMPLSGALSTLTKAPDTTCTYSDTTMLRYLPLNDAYEISILMPSFAKGSIGSPVSVAVQITLPNEDFSKVQTWRTDAGACTITFSSNVCLFFEGNTYYLISGTGSCSKPAVFQVPNVLDPPAALPPVTVGDFWFANEIYTPP
jgi:hypothetical protein